MSNSPLIDYIKISPNRTSPRNHVIDTITIHCVVGQCSVETLGNIFAPESRQASCNYGIGYDGRIGLYCPENDRSWCSSNAANDHRAITIEVASDTSEPYAVNNQAMSSLIKLLVDVCQRNNINELKWKADKSLIGQIDKQNMTVHRWFANKSCPGTYLYKRHGWIADQVNAQLKSNSTSDDKLIQNNQSENSIPSIVPFTIEVLIDNLNIRKSGSMSAKIIGTTGKGIFNIIETNSEGWGRLKSGAGWVYLRNPDYCKILNSNTPPSNLPYKVRISIDNLNIRTSPSAKDNSNLLGKYTKKGVFSIVEEATGPIDSSQKLGRWGLLASYFKYRNGWICLEVDGVDKL